MTPVRLLTVAVLFCTASAFSQEQLASASRSNQNAEPDKSARSTTLEPWTLVLNPPADPSVGKSGPQPAQIDAYKIDRSRIDPSGRPFRWGSQIDPIVLDGQAGADTVCYKIRSYVVARDSKNSDSVHPVGYSTCQPASRYRLKKVDIQTDSSGK